MSIDNTVPFHDETWTKMGPDGTPVVAMRVSSWDKSTRSSDNPAPLFGPNDTGEAMLKPVLARIDTIKGMLAESNGFDQRTGQPNYRYRDTMRANLERELLQLNEHTLPLTRLRAAEADAYHASQPTREDKMRAELERRQAISARALSLADEAEAEAQAKAILRNRGQLSMT